MRTSLSLSLSNKEQEELVFEGSLSSCVIESLLKLLQTETSVEMCLKD